MYHILGCFLFNEFHHAGCLFTLGQPIEQTTLVTYKKGVSVIFAFYLNNIEFPKRVYCIAKISSIL